MSGSSGVSTLYEANYLNEAFFLRAALSKSRSIVLNWKGGSGNRSASNVSIQSAHVFAVRWFFISSALNPENII